MAYDAVLPLLSWTRVLSSVTKNTICRNESKGHPPRSARATLVAGAGGVDRCMYNAQGIGLNDKYK